MGLDNELTPQQLPEKEADRAPAKLTPLMQQYWDIKSGHPDKIVLFRMGDFFEMFHRDAEVAAPILGIALTSRNKKSNDETPMCGVPQHSVAGPINKLLKAGHKVAICDQLEDPQFAKGIVKRGVTRILSPGVVFDPDTVGSFATCYLASYDAKTLSFLDLTTQEAFYFDAAQVGVRERLLCSFQPVEVVMDEGQDQEAVCKLLPGVTVSPHRGTLGDSQLPASCRRLLSYVADMQGPQILEVLTSFERRETRSRMQLGAIALRHLEIFENYRGEASGSLFLAVNRCKTAAGARQLKSWLLEPLADRVALSLRQDEVGRWSENLPKLKELRQSFAQMGDIARRLGKISNPSCHARDLLALSESLRCGLQCTALATHWPWLQEDLSIANAIGEEIERTIVPEPPLQLKAGGVIRAGVSPALDELIHLSTHANELLLQLEAREREATGISSLKVRYNQVFGYYIEVTHTHKDKVPVGRYQRKQTLANAERFITDELLELEKNILSAQTRRADLESEIFAQLKQQILKASPRLFKLARSWSELDVLSSLAWLATEQNYVRPRFTQGEVRLRGSRHPVVEQIRRERFVANDISLVQGQCLLLTGPNMAGKSTLMRQIAVTAILAQVGSFVPAAHAELPLYDRIFTRIGASDFLSEGLSTFMVEMQEAATILNEATAQSLIVLDEIGRGTSTFDGLSLAQAILEHLLEKVGATVLFATHYHELTALSQRYAQLLNAHMAIQEKGHDIRFLHSLRAGAASQSYGIHVARLAGLPSSITQRAKSLLQAHEAGSVAAPQLSLFASTSGPADGEIPPENTADQSAPAPPGSEILAELGEIALNEVTPIAALNLIARWQQELS